jgi:hypothetical protein
MECARQRKGEIPVMKLSPQDLIEQLSSNVDPSLARSVIDSYVEMQQRFLAGDHGPAELDGGRLCEAVSRAILQLDTGKLDNRSLPGVIRKQLLDPNKPHQLSQPDRAHIAKAIDVVYKFRSDRGPVHISPIHTPNLMDSMFVMHAGKWILAEFLRLAWSHDRKVIGEVIAQLVQLEHTIVHELDGQPMVIAKDISIPEEVLILLNHAPSNRLSRSEINQFVVKRSPKTVSTAITRMLEAKEVRTASNGDIALTPVGQQRILEVILPKYHLKP